MSKDQLLIIRVIGTVFLVLIISGIIRMVAITGKLPFQESLLAVVIIAGLLFLAFQKK